MVFKTVLLLTLFSYIAFGGAVAEEQDELFQTAAATNDNQNGIFQLFRGFDNNQPGFEDAVDQLNLHRVKRGGKMGKKRCGSDGTCRWRDAEGCQYEQKRGRRVTGIC